MGVQLAIEMQVFLGIVVFLTGICVGSFLNVVIYRVPIEKSVAFPPSHCPHCHHALSPKDLFPIISYILLKGKCRYCEAGISIRYPLIELLNGLIWLSIFLRFGYSIETLAFLFLFSILVAVFFIDMDHMIIPNGLVLLGMAGGLLIFIYNLFQPFSLFSPSKWYTPLIGMVSASGVLLVVALIGLLIYKNDGAMGMGDVKIFIPIGMFLGWKLAILALFLSIMTGGFISIFLLIFRIKDRKSAIPFGPFIILGTFLAVFFGNNLLIWYL